MPTLSNTLAAGRALPLVLGFGLLVVYLSIGASPDVPMTWWAMWLIASSLCSALVAYKTRGHRLSVFFLALPVAAWCVFWLVVQITVGRASLYVLLVSLLSFLFAIGIGAGVVAALNRVRQQL